MKGAGTFYGTGAAIPYDAEWYFQGTTQSRFTVKVTDQAFTFTEIVNGDKGWAKVNDDVKAMAAEEVAEAKEQLYVHWVSSLLPLKPAPSMRIGPPHPPG